MIIQSLKYVKLVPPHPKLLLTKTVQNINNFVYSGVNNDNYINNEFDDGSELKSSRLHNVTFHSAHEFQAELNSQQNIDNSTERSINNENLSYNRAIDNPHLITAGKHKYQQAIHKPIQTPNHNKIYPQTARPSTNTTKIQLQ